MSGFNVAPILQQCYEPLVAMIQEVTGLDAQHVVLGIPNRASMPSPGFVSVQAVVRSRLRTNLHEPSGNQFDGVGSVTVTSETLTVTTATDGELEIGQDVTMPGVTPGTTIAAFGTGSGGVGTYTLSAPAVATATDVPLIVGPASMNLEEGVQLRVQIDCYGPQSTAIAAGAEDWATMLSTTLRDNFGVVALAPNLTPLHADEARFVPLEDGEDQYEERWMLEAFFQYNPVTTVPQQYANVAKLTTLDVPSQAPYS